jgi:hypothetical protein
LADDDDVAFSAVDEDGDQLTFQVTYQDKLCRMDWKSLKNTLDIAYEDLMEEAKEEEEEASRFTEKLEVPSFYPIEVTPGIRV